MSYRSPLLALCSALFCGVLTVGCKPVCSAPSHVEMIMAGQRDMIQCPEQHLASSPEQIEAVQRCIRDAVAASRPFVTRIDVNGPSRGDGPRHVVGRVRGGELEVFVLFDVNAGQNGARVIGHRCDGFNRLNCSPIGPGVTCQVECNAFISEAPSPPFPAAPNNPGEVWCGPAW